MKIKKTPMNILLQLIGFVSVAYLTSSESFLETDNISEYQASLIMCTKTAEMKEEREKITSINKKLISRVLREKNNNTRINMLEGGIEEFQNMSSEDIESSICWDFVFTEEKESKIKHDAKNNALKDDFPIRLKVIIEELYNEMYMCFTFVSTDKFYSLEMINNIFFLKEFCLEYFLDNKYEIIGMVICYLYVHYLYASGLLEKTSHNKARLMICAIEDSDHELRKIILKSSRSFQILNSVINVTLNLDIPLMYMEIMQITNSFVISNIICCHESVRRSCEGRLIVRSPPLLLSIYCVCSINMENIYESLKKIKNVWNTRKYTDSEYSLCFLLYMIEFSYTNTLSTEYFNYCLGGYSQFTKILSLLKSNLSCRFTSFLIRLVSVEVTNILSKWYAREYSSLLMVCHQNLIKIVDYRKHLLNHNANKSFITLSDLTPGEGYNIFKAIIDCYSSYIGYIFEDLNITRNEITYNLEALHEIIKIISRHLEKIDSIIHNNDTVKYVELFCALKDLTSKTLNFDKYISSTAFSDYPHFLQFYEEYHMTGLHIDCIYNICFLLGKSHKGPELKLDLGNYSTQEETHFYKTAHIFIEHLRNIDYASITYDVTVYDTLDHIVRCIIEIKQGNFDNMSLKNDVTNYCTYDEANNIKANHDDTQSYLDVIEYKFWPKIFYFNDILRTFGEKKYSNYSIKDLYNAQCASPTDIRKLYDVCRALLCQGERKEIESLQWNAINRKNKNEVYVILSDIMFKAYRVIKGDSNRGGYDEKVMETAQFLFRSYELDYTKCIKRTFVAECNLTEYILIENKRSLLVAMLGIYALFDQRIGSYIILVRTSSIIDNLSRIKPDIRYVKKGGYKVLLSYCNYVYLIIRGNKDNSAIDNICTQIEHTLEAINSNDNDFEILSELFRFVSRTINIKDEQTKHNIIQNVGNISDKVHNMLRTCFIHSPMMSRTLKYIEMIFLMIKLVLCAIGTIPENTSTDFIDLSRSVYVELYENIKLFGMIDFVILKYKNIRDKFIILIDDFGTPRQWEAIYSLIVCRIDNEIISNSSKDVMKFIMIIENLFISAPKNDIDHSEFISAFYRALVCFFIEIDQELENYSEIELQFFSAICLLLEQNKILLEILGYRNITEKNIGEKCYICYRGSTNMAVVPVNCVCKSYISCLYCLLKYDLSKYTSQIYIGFTPICCICRN